MSPARRISERLLIGVTTAVSVCHAVAYLAYLVLRTVGGHW